MLRYPGRLLAPGEFVPPAVVDFIGRQLDLDGDELADYAVRSETRHEHLAELRRLYGFRSFADGAAHELGDRLREEAPRAQSNEDLGAQVRRGLPSHANHPAGHDGRSSGSAPTRWSTRNAGSKPASPSGFRPGFGADLEYLLRRDGRRRRDAVRLAQAVRAGQPIPPTLTGCWTASSTSGASLFRKGLFHDVPAHRITRLRRQGERYFADGLRELPDSRRLAILAVCAVEWELFLADAVVETHDRIVGRTYRDRRAYLRRAARGRDGRGPRGAPGVRRTGERR